MEGKKFSSISFFCPTLCLTKLNIIAILPLMTRYHGVLNMRKKVQKFVHHQYEFNSTVHLKDDPRFHPSLRFDQRIFLAELLSLINKDGKNEYKFTLRDLGSLFGISHETIRNWMNKLENLKIIETYSKNETVNSYTRPRKCYVREKK